MPFSFESQLRRSPGPNTAPEPFEAYQDVLGVIEDGGQHDLGQFVSMDGKGQPKPPIESGVASKDGVQH